MSAPGAGIRAGIHASEVDLAGDDVAGACVQISAGIAALAHPAEILVSRTVRDLVTGSGIGLAPRGQHKLGDRDDEWPLFAVTD